MRLGRMPLLLLTLVALSEANLAGAQDYQWAEQMFEKTEHDFGVVASGADMKYRLKMTNKYQQPVHIVGISTSCGCTVAKPAVDILPSGESTFIDITMNTRKVVAHKEIRLTVTFDKPAFAQAVIRVKAFINPDVLINPGEADFGSVVKGTEKTLRLALSYNGRGRSTITDLICKNPNLSAKLVPVRAGVPTQYELQVTLKSTAPMGELRDQVVLVTDDPANPHIPVLVEARIEAEFSVTPHLISFGTMAPGERITKNITVTGKEAFTIEKIESEKTAGVFETRIPKEARRVQVLPITMIAPSETGTVNEEFTLTISGRAEPLTFKVLGKVVVPGTASAQPSGAFVPANPRQ